MQTNESESFTFRFRTLKRVFFLLGILALGMTVLLFSNGSTAAAEDAPEPIYVWENIDANATWESGSVHIVNASGPILITNDAVLTIEPGAEVRFANGTGLIVENGKLIADASGNPALIIFSSNYTIAPTRGIWSGISVSEDGAAEFNNVAIRNASTAITCDNGTVGITDVTITNVLNGVDIYKDTDALGMSIVGLTITDYEVVGVSIWAQNETLDLEMTDCILTGLSGSVGVSTTSADELTGASMIALNNVTITGGLNAVEALATTDLELTIIDCAFNAQDGVAVTAEAVYGDSDVVMEGTTIDGTNADDSMTYYTVDADESYEFHMIEPDPTNRSSGGHPLHAVLPWDFYFGGNPYNNVNMYETGYVEIGGWGNWIAPCQNDNFATNGGSSFIGYVIDDEKAVFQWAVYDITDANDRMNVFQMILYANGEIQFVYDMMETDAVGDSYIDSFGWFFIGLDYDVDMVVGNPFDLEYTSYTLHPEDVSAGAGMYIASSEGNVNLDANDSVVRNFGDSAIWTYAQMGDITEQITNCQFWYIVSGVEDGAIDAYTEDGTLDVELTDNVFFTVWGWAIKFESSNTMGGEETIVVTDNRFTRCAGVGSISTFVDEYEDDEAVDLEFTADRWFNDNILIDCSILMTSLNVFADNSGWNITLNERMEGNQYTTIAYTGMMPFLTDMDLDGYAMISSWLGFWDWDGVSDNNIRHTLSVTGNTFDGMPTFLGFDGDYYTSAPKAVDVMELINTDGSLTVLESDVEISGNTIMAGGAEPDVMIDVNRELDSNDGDRTSILNTDVSDNQIGSTGSDGLYISLSDGAGGNDADVASVTTNNTVTVLGNTLTGCGLVADIMSYHTGVNLVGETSYLDRLSFQDNVMDDCAGMLTVNNNYYGGFDDFYPAWGEPISSTMDAEYYVQVESNTFSGNSVGDGNFVDVMGSMTVPGDAIYCSAEGSVMGSVTVRDNSITLMTEDGDLTASAEFGMTVDQSFYASGRNAVIDANVSAGVNDNVITGGTLFSGIRVSTGAYASTSDLRADLPDHSMVTLVASVEVLRNQIEGAFGGISVEHYASATNAMSEVHDTYDATISDNSVSASVWGIWAYVSDYTYTGSPVGSPTVDGTQSVTVANNQVSGGMEAYGIQLRLSSEYGYMGTLTASADFAVTGNTISECEQGIYVEMYPYPAQDQSLLVQDNILSDCVNNGIFVNGGVVDINNNTLTDGSGYGIYVQNAQGSVADNTVSGFPYSGIQINYCYDMAVTDNSITACAADDDWGMYLVNGENLSVIGNSIVGNYRGLYAIYLDGSSISGNNITGSTFEGVVLFKLSACQVENNVISDNGAYGVNIYGGYGVVFGNNTVWNNEGIGVDIDAGTDDQIWVYNGWYEYNDGYGIYVEAEPFSPGDDWFGVQWIIDGESRLTFNEVYYDGEIRVRSGGALYLDSLDFFQVRGSSVDGTATLLVEEGGMLWMLNTNVVSDEDDDIFEPLTALSGPISSYYEFIVHGELQATECSILHAESIYLGPTSKAKLVSCLIANYERSGINVDGCSPFISRCTIVGDSQGEPVTEGIVIEGEDAFPQITSCLIVANRHGIYARDADLGAVYDNIFLLNLQTGIYGETVVGKIHNNVFMLNKVEILLTKDSNVTISDNQIGWAKMIDDLAQYAPIIQLVGHHMFGLMESGDDLTGSEGDLMDMGMFGLDISQMLVGHVGVMAMDCERLVMTGNWYGMLYQPVYVMDCDELIFGDRIAPSNLTIPYYVGLNSSTMTVPIQCIEGLYAVRSNVNLVNAYIEVLDDALVMQGCTGSVFNSVLKGGDKNVLIVPSAPAAGAEGGGFLIKTVLKLHAEEDGGDSVSEAEVVVLNALGAEVARGETDDDGNFVCTIVSYIVSADGKDSSMNPYEVTVAFDNGDVSKEFIAVDPLDGSWTTAVTVTADADNTWAFVGVTVLAIFIILIVVAYVMRKKKA